MDDLSIDVPAPLAKFRGSPIIDADNQLILASVKTPKILNNRQLNQYRRRLSKLERQLKRAGVDQALAEWRNLRDGFYALLFDLRDLGTQHAANMDETTRAELIQQGRQIKRARRRIRARAAQIETELEQYRTDIIARNTLRYRIDEYRVWSENQTIERRLSQEMATEANNFAEIIQRAWNALGYCYEYTDRKGIKRRRTVQFEKIIATPDSLQIKILASKLALFRGTINMLPQGVHISKLIDEDTLLQLTVACERPVTCPQLQESRRTSENRLQDTSLFTNGVWLEVHRQGVIDGILAKVDYRVLMARYEDRFREQYALPLGARKGRHINWVKLTEHPHLLVAGQTGSGKSNTINVALATLITKHSPNELRLVLIDLKEGVELRRYDGIPHMVGPVVTEIDDVEHILYRIEMLRRDRMLEIRTLAHDIVSYNDLVPSERKMPRILIVFDEYGALQLNAGIAKRVYDLTAQLAMKSRAAGIHLLIGAQTPYNDVVPNHVKANITLVMAGRQRTLGSSISTLGNKSATELAKIPGRMLCDDGQDSFEVQIPYISPAEIKDAIAYSQQFPTPVALPLPALPTETQIIEGEAVEVPVLIDKPFTLDDFVGLCLAYCDGLISPQRAHKFAPPNITQRQLIAMRDELVAFTSVTHDGNEYIVQKYKSGYRLNQVSSQANEPMSIPVDLSSVIETAYVEGESK